VVMAPSLGEVLACEERSRTSREEVGRDWKGEDIMSNPMHYDSGYLVWECSWTGLSGLADAMHASRMDGEKRFWILQHGQRASGDHDLTYITTLPL